MREYLRWQRVGIRQNSAYRAAFLEPEHKTALAGSKRQAVEGFVLDEGSAEESAEIGDGGLTSEVIA